MFWKKKTPFRDVAIRELLDGKPQDRPVRAATTLGLMTMAMQHGIAIGAQFPAKVLPIMRQAEGGRAQEGYVQMKERLERRFALAADMSVERGLHFFPPIAELMEAVGARGVEYFTHHQFVESIRATFYYGLVMGSLHWTVSLRFLEAAIEDQNVLLSLAKEAAPELFTTYTRFLVEAREAMLSYEKENGTLR